MKLARANAVLVVLFFAVSGALGATDDELRRALAELSVSYTNVQHQLADREIAMRTLTESLAIARTESELFQKLWTEAQVRAQTFGANVTDANMVGQQRQFVDTLRALYLADAERQKFAEQLQRLVVAVESNVDVMAEVVEAKRLLKATSRVGAADGGGSLELTKILEVNPKLRLVVLDIGVQQGARVGMPLTVWRKDHGVAEVRIVEVRPKISGAVVERVDNNVTLQAGDTARVSKN